MLGDNPGVVIDVADASNLKRNLYLTLQLLEMEVPTILNLNMMDVAERRGQVLDVEKLENLLGAPVVPTTAKKGIGDDALREAVSRLAANRPEKAFRVDYGRLRRHSELEGMLAEDPVPASSIRFGGLPSNCLKGIPRPLSC